MFPWGIIPIIMMNNNRRIQEEEEEEQIDEIEKEIMPLALFHSDLHDLKNLDKTSRLYRLAEKYNDLDADYHKNYYVERLVENIIYPYSHEELNIFIEELYQSIKEIRKYESKLIEEILVVDKENIKSLLEIADRYEKAVDDFDKNNIVYEERLIKSYKYDDDNKDYQGDKYNYTKESMKKIINCIRYVYSYPLPTKEERLGYFNITLK